MIIPELARIWNMFDSFQDKDRFAISIERVTDGYSAPYPSPKACRELELPTLLQPC